MINIDFLCQFFTRKMFYKTLCPRKTFVVDLLRMLSVADLTISPVFWSAIEFALHWTMEPCSALVGFRIVSETVVNVWLPLTVTEELSGVTSKHNRLNTFNIYPRVQKH